VGLSGSFPLDLCMHARTRFPVSPKEFGDGLFCSLVSFLCHEYSCLLGRRRGLCQGVCVTGIVPGSSLPITTGQLQRTGTATSIIIPRRSATARTCGARLSAQGVLGRDITSAMVTIAEACLSLFRVCCSLTPQNTAAGGQHATPTVSNLQQML